MSPDRSSLLDALRDGADGLTVLVYADWLEEHGDAPDRARAEFIRLRAAPQPDAEAAQRRGTELWAEYGKRWARGLPPDLAEAMCRHGVLRGVAARTADFVRGAEVLLREPVGRARLLGSTRRLMEQLAECTALGCLRELVLPGRRVSQGELRPLLASPHLGRLRVLRVPAATLTTQTAEALGQAPGLAGLRVLDLGHYERDEASVRNDRGRSGRGSVLREEGVRALAGSPHLAGLEALYLNGCCVGPGGPRLLADSPVLASLRRLDLGHNGLRDDALHALLGGPLLARLTRLELYSNSFTGAAIAALAGNPAVGGLELLDLSGTYDAGSGLGDDAARALAGSPHLAGLEHLLLGHNRIGPEGIAALAGPGGLASLRTLVLDRNPVGRGGAEALASSPLLGRLAELGLNDVGLDDAGALALARSRHAPDGLRLDVGGNRGLSAGAADELRRRFGAGVVVSDPGDFVEEEYE